MSQSVEQIPVIIGAGGSGGSAVWKYNVDNYSDLSSIPSPQEGEIARVRFSQGTKWLPGTLGGSYYPSGFYEYRSGTWEIDETIEAVAEELENLIATKLDSVVGGTDISIDATNPKNPVINFTGTAGGVQSVTGDGVGGTASDVVLSFPDADEVDDSGTTNKFVQKLSVNLDSAESSVTRSFSGGRTTFTITHNFGSKDVLDRVYRLSDDRRINWRIETPTANTLEASRAGNVANGLFRITLIE